MIGAYASAIVLVFAAFAVGQALIALSRSARPPRRVPVCWLSPAIGLAALLVVGGLAARLPGHGVTAAVVLVAAVLVSLLYLRGRILAVAAALRVALPVAIVAVAAASLPFVLNGEIGILGVGLVNDDMASHLLIADYARFQDEPVPSFVRGGYPTGPHTVTAALAEGPATGLVEAFAGLTLALAALAALLALHVVGELPAGRRLVAAVLASLPYLGAAYLAQGAFKEPLEALILIGFALELWRVLEARPGPLGTLPLGVLAAGSAFNYSLPGLLLVAAVMALIVGARAASGRVVIGSGGLRRAALLLGVGAAVVAVATAQEWGRITSFSRISAINPDRFGSDLGNLRHPLSPLEALGVWPSGEYRISAVDASLPAVLFYAGAVLAAIALAIGLVRAWRTRRFALPLALLAVAGAYGTASAISTPYIAAKALAIAAPMAMLVALRGVLEPGSRARLAVAVLFVPAAALSSFLALRQAPVAPDAHASQLAEIRPVVSGEEVLFLGRDDFIAFELRGADVFGVVENHYDAEELRSRFRQREGGGEKFDFDALHPGALERFRYVLTTNGGPQSRPPPRYRAVAHTRDYTLWERRGEVGQRRTLDEGASPGAILRCDTAAGRAIASGDGFALIWPTPPVESPASRWRPTARPTDERTARQRLRLGPGRWLVSLQYDSRRPLEVTIGERRDEAPANLDFRGPTPYFPVGEIEIDRPRSVAVEVRVDDPNPVATLLRAPNEAHLRGLSATPLGDRERVPLAEACGRYVDWYRAES